MITSISNNQTVNIVKKNSTLLKKESSLKTESKSFSPLSSISYKANFLPFCAKTSKKTFDLNSLTREVNKEFQGAGLIDDFDCIDWSKVGWENLQKEPLNWKTAEKKDIMAFYQALSLAENKNFKSVSRFNPGNVPEPLATFHTVKSSSISGMYSKMLSRLDKIASSDEKPDFLDKPLMDEKTGKINLDLVVFDTETTGIKLNPYALDYETIDKTADFAKGSQVITDLTNPDHDRILQIGAVKIHPGDEIKEEEILNQLVDPQKPIPPQASAVHHITDEMVTAPNVPTMEKVLKKFNDEYLGNNLIVAYNAKFDTSMLNNAIFEYNENHSDKVKPRELSLILDPFILIQRIHPFVGSSKKLTEQHKFFFGKGFEGAHDALADATATINMLKYCCLYLAKHYDSDKAGKPLTVKDLLTFQFGGKVEGLDIDLNNGYDSSKSFKNSYKHTPVSVTNYFDGYKVVSPKKDEIGAFLNKWSKLIGEENAETLLQEMSGRKYKTYHNFKEALDCSGIKEYGDKSKEDVFKLIAENSEVILEDECIRIWTKNLEPDKEGQTDNLNDMPDFEISKKIMLGENS